jgi:hypothetical protein
MLYSLDIDTTFKSGTVLQDRHKLPDVELEALLAKLHVQVDIDKVRSITIEMSDVTMKVSWMRTDIAPS